MPPETRDLVRELVELVNRWQDGNTSVLSDLASEFRGLRDGAAGLLRDVSVIRKEVENVQGSLKTLWDKFDKCYDTRQDRYSAIKKDVLDNQSRKEQDICSRLRELSEDYDKFKTTGFVKTQDFETFRKDEFGKIRDKFWWIVGSLTVGAAGISALLSHFLQHHSK